MSHLNQNLVESRAGTRIEEDQIDGIKKRRRRDVTIEGTTGGKNDAVIDVTKGEVRGVTEMGGNERGVDPVAGVMK